MWNPSTCACECDMWCKLGQTMMNNVDNKDNDNTIIYIFIGLFSVLLFIGIVCFCVIIYFKFIKGKKLFKNKYTYDTYKNGY